MPSQPCRSRIFGRPHSRECKPGWLAGQAVRAGRPPLRKMRRQNVAEGQHQPPRWRGADRFSCRHRRRDDDCLRSRELDRTAGVAGRHECRQDCASGNEISGLEPQSRGFSSTHIAPRSARLVIWRQNGNRIAGNAAPAEMAPLLTTCTILRLPILPSTAKLRGCDLVRIRIGNWLNQKSGHARWSCNRRRIARKA